MTFNDIISVRSSELCGKVQETGKTTRTAETLEIKAESRHQPYLRAQNLERRCVGIDYTKQVEGTFETSAAR